MQDNTQLTVFLELLASAQQSQSITISYIQRRLRMGYSEACQLHHAMLTAQWIEITAEGYMPVQDKWMLSRSLAKDINQDTSTKC